MSYSILLAFIYLIAYLSFLFIFRKSTFSKQNQEDVGSQLIFSPVNGNVIDIKYQENKTILTLRVSLFSGYSVLMPFSGQIEGYENVVKSINSKSFFNLENSKTKILFKPKKIESSFKIKAKSKFVIDKPCFWVRSGDRISIGATIGYLPFGGKIVIEVPKNTSLKVKEGDHVQACETIVACID